MLQRVWALIALMFECLRDPERRDELERLFAEADQLFARLIFEGAARIAGRTDLLETHEAYIVSKGRSFDIRVRLKPCARHPWHRIILARWRAQRIARYRRAMGRRTRFSRKLSYLHFRNQRRTHSGALCAAQASTIAPPRASERAFAPP